MEGKFNGTLFYAEIPPGVFAPKNVQINIHQSFEEWRARNPQSISGLPPALQREERKRHQSEPSAGIRDEPGKKSEEESAAATTNPLESHGKFLFQGKIAELEDRIISAGIVGSPKDLDLADPFIDDQEYASEASVSWMRSLLGFVRLLGFQGVLCGLRTVRLQRGPAVFHVSIPTYTNLKKVTGETARAGPGKAAEDSVSGAEYP